jgi:CPA1 family monovalent cation:H+ antiporter
LIWVFPSAYLPRLLSRRIVEKEGPLNWKPVFVIGWSGMRGVVSLASALAIPLTLADGTAFPHRNLILFITFAVILFTLVLQGLSLPLLLRVLKLEVVENDISQEQQIRHRLATAVIAYLDDNCGQEIEAKPLFRRVKEKYERMAEIAEKQLNGEDQIPAFIHDYRQMLLEIIEVRRGELKKMHRNKEFADQLIRARERELDLEEARTRKN